MPQNGIDSPIRWRPTQLVVVGVCSAVVVTVPHDVRATAIPHHDEKQPCQNHEVENISKLHGPLLSLLYCFFVLPFVTRLKCAASIVSCRSSRAGIIAPRNGISATSGRYLDLDQRDACHLLKML